MFKKMLQNLFSLQVAKGKSQDEQTKRADKQPLSTHLRENLDSLKQIFDLSADIVFREFKINTEKPSKAAIIYIKGITDSKTISSYILEPLMLEFSGASREFCDEVEAIAHIQEQLSTAASVQKTSILPELVTAVLNANVALLLDNASYALLIEAPGGESRAVNEPDSEPIVRGPKDGFVENLDTNLTLLRRRIRSSQFKVEALQVGSQSRTRIAVCYIQGIADEKLINEVKTRIGRIRIDGILASGYIEEMIRDEPFSLFPLIQSTERPDKTAGSLLEGRVAILVDNTPMTLIVPCTFVTLLNASEDYYITPSFATFVRILRFIALNIALLLPSMTVAAFAFHQELIPFSLLNTVAGARQEMPFPIFLEILAMEVTFELLREAGVRLPKTIGQAISTVGGLVIGQAAVNAGFVSPLSVIVVATTAVASFTVPNYPVGTTIRILRFLLLLFSAVLGAVGIMLGLMGILFHLNRLRSFGVPYLTPIAPLSPRDLKDTFIRLPWWAMITRPRFFGSKVPERQPLNQGPQKPEEEGDNHQ